MIKRDIASGLYSAESVRDRVVSAGLDALDDLRIKAIADYRKNLIPADEMRDILMTTTHREIALLVSPPSI